MQFSCESNVLAKGINTVKRAISSSSQAPIFQESISCYDKMLYT